MGRKLGIFTIILIVISISSVAFTSTEYSRATSPLINGVLAHSLSEAQANALSSNGINWIRSDVSLQEDSNWNAIYQLAKKYNLSLIGTLDPYTMNFNDSADWQQVVQSAVNSYGDKVNVWEIWNEPNNTDSKCGIYQGTAQQYVDLIKIAYQTIKSTQNDSIVLGLGGLALYSGGNTTYLDQAIAFARNVTEFGGMNYCDAISLHAYPWENNQDLQKMYQANLDLYKQLTGKEIWITETGQESGDNKFDSSEIIQAKYLTDSYEFFKSQVKAYIWYELNDNNPGKSSDFQNNSSFGLYDNNSTPKQSLTNYFEAVKNPLPAQPHIADFLGNSLIWYFIGGVILAIAVLLVCFFVQKKKQAAAR